MSYGQGVESGGSRGGLGSEPPRDRGAKGHGKRSGPGRAGGEGVSAGKGIPGSPTVPWQRGASGSPQCIFVKNYESDQVLFTKLKSLVKKIFNDYRTKV